MVDKIDTSELRIRCVSKKTNDELENIANHIGIMKAQLIRKKLREIADSYPAEMKEDPIDVIINELRITGLQPKVKKELINIAANLNIKLSPFLKMKLQEIADSFEPRYKQKFNRFDDED